MRIVIEDKIEKDGGIITIESDKPLKEVIEYLDKYIPNWEKYNIYYTNTITLNYIKAVGESWEKF